MDISSKDDLIVNLMKETSVRRITVTSSLNETSMDQLGKGIDSGGGGEASLPTLYFIPLFLQLASGQILKNDVNSFFSPPWIFASWFVCSPFWCFIQDAVLSAYKDTRQRLGAT